MVWSLPLLPVPVGLLSHTPHAYCATTSAKTPHLFLWPLHSFSLSLSFSLCLLCFYAHCCLLWPFLFPTPHVVARATWARLPGCSLSCFSFPCYLLRSRPLCELLTLVAGVALTACLVVDGMEMVLSVWRILIVRVFVEQGDFGTQKEAAWAISNLTISGRKDQVGVSSVLLPISSPHTLTHILTLLQRPSLL